jgi:hypothetical protein
MAFARNSKATVRVAENLSLLAGWFLISYGAYSIYPPAGFITGGVLLVAGTILRAVGG